MPALYLFHRRTLLAGDDLHLPSLASGLVRLIQLFGALPYLLYYVVELVLASVDDASLGEDRSLRKEWDAMELDGMESHSMKKGRSLLSVSFEFWESSPSMESSSCMEATSNFSDMTFPYLLLSYLVLMAMYCAVELRCERRVFALSSLGTPTAHCELRAPLGKLIEFKTTVLAGINAALCLYGSSFTFPFIASYLRCFPALWWIVWFALLATQGVQLLLSLATLLSIWKIEPATPDSEDTSRPLSPGNAGFYHRHVDHSHDQTNLDLVEEIWRSRCEGCCRMLAVSTCFLFGGRGIVSQEGGAEHFYGDIARALADYFADYGQGTPDRRGLDIVPSDVATGIVLLRHIQAQRTLFARREALRQTCPLETPHDSSVTSSRRHSSSDRTTLLFRWRNAPSDRTNDAPHGSSHTDAEPYEPFSRKILSRSNAEDVAMLAEGARFARHQLAIYTWVLYFYMFPFSGTFRLLGRMTKASFQTIRSNDGEQPPPPVSGITDEHCSLNQDVESGPADNQAGIQFGTTVGDNFLRIHKATLMAHAGLDQSDLIYASFQNGFYETPYCIVIDRKWKSVVLSIRGSLTLEDCVVDVLLDPTPLDALGKQYGFNGTGHYCHGGVLECAQWVYGDLQRHDILDRLLRDNAEYSDYTFRIVGHSLGAGIAVILSLIMRQKYPSLRCICYSPPGGLLSWKLAKECSSFVNTFVLDSDIVPRLSIDNMERLRDEVLHLIARVKISKFEIAKRIFKYGCCGEVEPGDLEFLIQQNDDMLYSPDDIPDSDFLRQLRHFDSFQTERRASRGISRSIGLYPPGNIVHLIKSSQSKHCLHGMAACLSCGASNAGFHYIPVRKENDDFNEICISPTLWTDHFPNRVCVEVEEVAREFGIDTALGSVTT